MSSSDADYVRVYRDTAGEFRWAAVAGNGEIVAEGESHRDLRDAARAARGVFGDTIEIRDETGDTTP